MAPIWPARVSGGENQEKLFSIQLTKPSLSPTPFLFCSLGEQLKCLFSSLQLVMGWVCFALQGSLIFNLSTSCPVFYVLLAKERDKQRTQGQDEGMLGGLPA